MVFFAGVYQDIGYAVRGLFRTRGVTAVAIVSLALGIGANAVIFSVVDAALLRPLPYHEPDRLVELLVTAQTLGGDRVEVELSGRRVADLRALPQIFESSAGYSPAIDVALAEGVDFSVRVGSMSPALPGVLGIAPQLGRAFSQEDVDAGNVLVISDAYWQRAFNRSPAVIGQGIDFAGGRRVIVGVMPPTFRYFVGAEPVGWLPLADGTAGKVVARLRSGLSVEDAQRELDAAIASPSASWKPLGVRIMPGDWNRAGEYFGRGVRSTGTMLFCLLGAVGLLLAIGCANVANLQLARTVGRQREIAVRRALGAGRARVARQFLTEGLVLAACGCAAALLLAWWGVRALPAIVPADLGTAMFGVAWPQLDERALAFGCLISLVTGLACGSTSAVRAFTGGCPDALLATGGQRITGRSRLQRRVHGVLQGSQVGMTVVLLFIGGLLLTSAYRMSTIPPGFDREGLGYASIDFQGTGARGTAAVAQRRAFIGDLLDRLAAVPAITAVTAGVPPAGGRVNGGFMPVEGGVAEPDEARAEVYTVRTNYFDVARIELKAGRHFDTSDGADAHPVAIVNEATARRFWPDGSAVGRQFRQFAGDDDEPPTTIVGVVADVRSIGLMRQPVQVYRPAAQTAEPSEIVFRTAGELAPVVSTIRSVVRELDGRVAVTRAGSVDNLFAELGPIRTARFYAAFFALFAIIALVTAAIGIYGVLSYTVKRRTLEIGVRVALGASAARVRWMVAREVFVPVFAGIGAGATAALWLSRLLTSQLFQVAPGNPVVLATVVLLLPAVGLIAAAVPLRRALRIDPAVALRDE